jgi:hypothetical protein
MTRPHRRLKDGSLPESAYGSQLEGLLNLYGWLWYHTHDSRRSKAGFPDYTAVREHELLFIELKGPKTRVSAEQRVWLEALTLLSSRIRGETPDDAHVEAHLWRFPQDFDEAHERLARGRVRQEPIYR